LWSVKDNIHRNDLGYIEHISEHGAAPIESGTVINIKKNIYGDYTIVSPIGDNEIIPEPVYLILLNDTSEIVKPAICH